MDIIQYQFAIYSSSKNCPNVLHFCNVYNTTLNKDIIPKKYITNTALSQFAFGQELDSQYIKQSSYSLEQFFDPSFKYLYYCNCNKYVVWPVGIFVAFSSFDHHHLLPSGCNGCWGDYYTTKPLTLILSSFTFWCLFLPVLWGNTFFYLMLDAWALCHVFSTFDLVETCQVMSLLVHRKELQVVTSANRADWEENAKLWVFYEALGLWPFSL